MVSSRCLSENGRVPTLTGRLLLAVPRAHDEVEGDIFARSVVLVLHHGDDGAQGLVLTAPLDVGVDSVLPGWQAAVCPPDRLFQGGPVGLDTAIGLANVPGTSHGPGVTRLFGALAVVDLDEQVEQVARQAAAIRIFAGSCGWDAGQLDTELADAWWVRTDFEIGDVFDDDPATLWRRIMQRQPAPTRWMASFPRDPSLN